MDDEVEDMRNVRSDGVSIKRPKSEKNSSVKDVFLDFRPYEKVACMQSSHVSISFVNIIGFQFFPCLFNVIVYSRP